MLDDKYTIRLEFADQFKPENNTQVAEAIQSASETEKNNGLPALDQTLPFATLKTAEDLLDNLRDVVAETADPIEFDYLAIWLFDKTKKAKMGKPNSEDGNPPSHLTCQPIQPANRRRKNLKNSIMTQKRIPSAIIQLKTTRQVQLKQLLLNR